MSCGSDTASTSFSSNKRMKIQSSADVSTSKSDEGDDKLCGICYSDNGVSIRGEIDCCNHYFCFVCIMEWAKHESRCPICRQRFSTIRRPPKPGVFPSFRVVKVPVRDQVYHHNGNVTTGPVDPYAQVQCCVCHGNGDDSLLLLCDLCDTGSHTYCVGLGYTVPEGDWFCHDCTVSWATSSDNGETDKSNVMPRAETSVSMFDILKEPNRQVVTRPRSPPSQQNQSFSPEMGARTLHRCRYVRRSIQALRENWNVIRNGSLGFCSTSRSDELISQRQNGKSNPLHSMPSVSQQHSPIQHGPSSSKLHDEGLKDVDKAWKMMNRARMMHRTQLGTSGVKKILENRRPSKLQVQEQRRVNTKKVIKHARDHSARQLPEYCELPFSGRVHSSSSIQSVSCHESGDKSFTKEQSTFNSRASFVGSAPSRGKCVETSSSGREVGNKSNRNQRLDEICKGGKTGKTDDAKNEIKSLVKLNLKVLSRDKKLGVDMFKEVGRCATHTILSACISEQQKSDIFSSSSVLKCNHSEGDVQPFHKSTLMPNSCRQCFYAFVNSVVNSIMLDKVGSARTL
ncbi:hypothetical protein L6164_014467 [Bauhinia variegata]|uniref:Uncharacterized protein n=1 Tax=Bauhinia variegata TaxID=167791 RepID=A0ACB9NH81_BAUVA|nr:hypothetical protein L6164_014467 [Bauhinia variegata]